MDHIDKNYLWPCNGYHTVLITHCLYLIEAVPVSDISQIQLVGFLLIYLVTLLGMDIMRITVYCTCAIIARSLVQYRQTDKVHPSYSVFPVAGNMRGCISKWSMNAFIVTYTTS